MPITTSVTSERLKTVLSNVMVSANYGMKDLVLNDYLMVDNQTDNYEDDLEVGGPGLAAQKDEGALIFYGTQKEGAKYRYQARTFAIGLVITEEAQEDGKYKESINMSRDCGIALYKTADTDAALLLARGFNTSYAYGNGQPLWSSSHPLPQGGTFSNVFATALPPGVAAVDQARVQARKMPDQHGVFGDFMLKSVVFPVDQESEWERILNSKLDTDSANNFSRTNIANRMASSGKLKAVPVVYWSNTTSNYCFMTNAKGGPQWRWRRKPRFRSTDGFDNETVKFKASARWSRGTSNPRGTIGVQA